MMREILPEERLTDDSIVELSDRVANADFVFLTVKETGLWLEVDHEVAILITELADFSLLHVEECMCSSSVDFPYEYTNDITVINMCEALRSC